MKPIQTFERFLKNFSNNQFQVQTAHSSTNVNPNGSLTNANELLSSSAQTLNNVGKQSFKYDLDMNIKSINSSGMLPSNDPKGIHYTNGLINNVYKPRIQTATGKKRTQSYQRVNSAKVSQNELIGTRAAEMYANSMLSSNNPNFRQSNISAHGKSLPT